MWKLIFVLFFTCWAEWGIGQNTKAGVIRVEQNPAGLCSTFVQPYYSNYDCHEYSITTTDGFRLGIQRINTRSDLGQKGPVFLNHGVLSGGDTWVLNPPDQSDKSSAFILANAGYDVWIGNARTTRYSYGHENLTEQDAAYWDWSLDELAAIDLPEMLHMVNSITNKKIYYIGFSQGSQAALAALSEGNLGDVVEKLALLAPVAYVSHAYTPIGVAAVNLHLDQVFEALGLHSFTTKTETGQHYVDLICKAANLACYEDLASAFTGINCCINSSRIAFYDKYETQATSTKNLIHLAQLYRADKFQKYDYGLVENMKRYNFITPPVYDLFKVPTQNLMLAYGAMDALANLLDVERLKVELNSGYKYVFKPLYAHLDFILAYNLKEEVYDHIIEFFQN